MLLLIFFENIYEQKPKLCLIKYCNKAMKASFFITIISLLLLIGCSSLNSSKKIKVFEQTLGADNAQALTQYVNAFENEVLKKQYPTLTIEKAYAQLLSEDPRTIVNMKLYNQFSNYNLENYFKSQLWHEIYAPVDSIWFENLQYSIRCVYLSEHGKKIVTEISSSYETRMNKDSIIQSELGLCMFNRKGKYFKAIKSSKSGIPFFEEYYHAKDVAGEIGIAMFANMIKQNKLAINDYLAKRIIAIELGKFINDGREPKKYSTAFKDLTRKN